METDLYSETLRLARESGESVPDLARATGLKQRWLHRLLAGDFNDPGVRKIERLHRHLMGHAQSSADQAA